MLSSLALVTGALEWAIGVCGTDGACIPSEAAMPRCTLRLQASVGLYLYGAARSRETATLLRALLAAGDAVRVLIACEYSGAVRRAFRDRGHDAWSCDYLDPEDGDPHHFKGSVIDHDIIKLGWDMLIGFPDCTFLTVSANRWADAPWRMEARHWALAFVKTLWALPIQRKCLENPIGVLRTMWRRPTQIVQPHEFWHLGEPGKGEVKATCLYLDGLPPLVPTTPDEPGRHPACWLQPPSDERWKERSRTYPGIADAMGEQWGRRFLENSADSGQILETAGVS